MMKALGWDDDPKEYFKRLQTSLKHVGIALEIERKADRFRERLISERWDLVLTDLVDDLAPAGTQDRTGLQIAREICSAVDADIRQLPVFIVTNWASVIDPSDYRLGHNVVVMSKDLSPAWMAQKIKESLNHLGVYVDKRKVFLIYGHDNLAPGSTASVRQFLEHRGLETVTVEAGNLFESIDRGLVERMRNCAAIVALCTPDDALVGGAYHARPNVMLEIGIAMGLARGPRRLIILQHELVKMATDIGGIITLRFKTSVDEIFPTLVERFKHLGVEQPLP